MKVAALLAFWNWNKWREDVLNGWFIGWIYDNVFLFVWIFIIIGRLSCDIGNCVWIVSQAQRLRLILLKTIQNLIIYSNITDLSTSFETVIFLIHNYTHPSHLSLSVCQPPNHSSTTSSPCLPSMWQSTRNTQRNYWSKSVTLLLLLSLYYCCPYLSSTCWGRKESTGIIWTCCMIFLRTVRNMSSCMSNCQRPSMGLFMGIWMAAYLTSWTISRTNRAWNNVT